MSGKLVRDFMRPITDEDFEELTGEEVAVSVDADASMVAALMPGRERLPVFDRDPRNIVGFVTRKELPDPPDWAKILWDTAPTCTCTNPDCHKQGQEQPIPSEGEPPYKCSGCGQYTCD